MVAFRVETAGRVYCAEDVRLSYGAGLFADAADQHPFAPTEFQGLFRVLQSDTSGV